MGFGLLDRFFGSKQPVYPGHTYTSAVTGERFVVKSVAPNVPIERLDAEQRPEYSVRLELLRDAIESGHVLHDEDRCPQCPRNSGVE